jgi:hypothetical protein
MENRPFSRVEQIPGRNAASGSEEDNAELHVAFPDWRFRAGDAEVRKCSRLALFTLGGCEFRGFRNSLYYMGKLDFPTRISQASHQPTSDERYDRKSSYDADSRSTLRAGVQSRSSSRTCRCPGADRSVNSAIIASSTLSCGYSTRACNGSACRCPGQPTGRLESITRPFAEFSRNGPMMAHLIRRSLPA